jgi:hypothetical protein
MTIPKLCQCCDRPLRGKTIWLELDQRTWTYHDFGGVPADKSQGSFEFGPTCAKRKRSEARVEQMRVALEAIPIRR